MCVGVVWVIGVGQWWWGTVLMVCVGVVWVIGGVESRDAAAIRARGSGA
jgi:hypothetical protein